MAGNAKNNFIVDASFVLAFLLPDERSPQIQSYFDKFKDGQINFLSTRLLFFEVLNGLTSALKSKRVNKQYCLERLGELLDYGIKINKIDFQEAFLLAQKYDLAFYDASYLSLPQAEKLPLLTLDKHFTPFSTFQTS